MGIPSFYKHLLQTVGGLTAKERPTGSPQVFALDLNCAIYHSARKRVKMAYTQDAHEGWEAALIQDVLVYITELTRRVNPTEVVYVAVDGVAPMAKIKQQRARRFKSAVLAAEEAAVRRGSSDRSDEIPPASDEIPPRWDSNAITPGTAFMSKLTAALRSDQLQRALNVKVVVSPADEAGEGEQKIMAFLRRHPDMKDAVVYGLDADLIVLALLEHGRTGRIVDLFREETEFGGGVKMSNTGSEECLYLLVGHLASVMYQQWSPPTLTVTLSGFLGDFVGLMNLLGNDFVPHGMALKIHDEGVERVLEAWRSVRARGLPPLVVGSSYSIPTLRAILILLAVDEERGLIRGIRNKLDARVGGSASKGDAVDRAVARMNDRPVEWAAERCLAEQKHVRGEEKPKWFLRQDWRQRYSRAALWDADVGMAVSVYCQTLTWTLQYYMGCPVDPTFYYPWLLPPLLEDIVNHMNPAAFAAISIGNDAGCDLYLKPIEQLAMVLPVTSMHLLPPELQTLPARFPWAWPTGWAYFSLGRRFLWECEPLIPLIQPAQIRRWVEECRDG